MAILVKGRRFSIKNNDIPPVDPTILDEFFINSSWTSRLRSEKALNSAGQIASEGEPVLTLVDELGDRDAPYVGVSNPYLGMPYMLIQSGIIADKDVKMVYFKNQSNILYASEQSSGLSESRTLGFLLAFPDYQIYEAFIKTYGTVYIGVNSGRSSSTDPFNITFRTTNDGNNITVDNFISNSLHSIIYRLERDGRETENPGKIAGKLYLDGVLLNPSLLLETFNTLQRIEVVGTDTNCMMMGFVELFTAYTALDESEIVATHNALESHYGSIGTRLNLPVATNVNAYRNGDTITAEYDFQNPLGFAEDISSRRIVWEEGVSLQTMTQVTSVDDQMTFSASATGRSFNDSVRLNIFVKDVEGNEFKLPGVTFGFTD